MPFKLLHHERHFKSRKWINRLPVYTRAILYSVCIVFFVHHISVYFSSLFQTQNIAFTRNCIIITHFTFIVVTLTNKPKEAAGII